MQITSPVKSVLALHVSRHRGDGSKMFDLLEISSSAANQKEPLIPHSVPGLRWEKVAVDIMNYQGHDYIVVVDLYSKYPERAVRTMKNILKKANAEGRDPYLALLAYRNTADAGMSYLPAQMLTSRSLNTKLPTLPSLLQPKVVDARPQLEQRHQRHKAVLDRGAHELTELHSGDVCVTTTSDSP